MERTGNLWGGRFTGEANEEFARFNSSFTVDQRLLDADIRASIAHANALVGTGVLSADDAEKISNALKTIAAAEISADAEDVHSYIEQQLVAAVGELGKKLHTGRSRNDQVATAFRLWLRDEIDDIAKTLKGTQAALVAAAERHIDAVMPGYTHLQRAQPVLWAHWCLAYLEMFSRDIERFADARKRVNVLPLGSAALAGTSFDIDREAVAKELGFDSVSRNSLDAVSDRDFAVEFAAACSLVMVHLSRLAEDLILYASQEFGFVELGDAVSTGSSLMPQKKNPDALELIRGKAGRVFGHQTAMLAIMKGLPLAYDKDMQEDKEAVFDAADTVRVCLEIAAIVLDNLTVNEDTTRQAASSGYLNATELADHLVKRGMPFRDAHDAVGRLVLLGIESGRELHELSIEEMRTRIPDIDDSVFEALSLQATLASKSSIGGTSPERVRAELAGAKAKLQKPAREQGR
ncbi:MAG: argininosuccinate lyase [Acidobacteriota bacterium]|nr:MAG: argininosuccinate lyase [Acidobacteriota bacterium]